MRRETHQPYDELQRMSEFYNRRNDLAKKWGQIVRTQANNERSTQIRVVKAMWLNNASPLSLVNYDMDHVPPRVQIAETVSDLRTDEGEGLDTIEALQALINSDQMLAHPVIYDFLCAGLESGNFKKTEPMPISTISDLCTPAHEAHFRVELWFTLPHWDYRHSISKAHAHQRIAKWNEILPLVFKDRAENEEAAHKARKARICENGVSDVANDPIIGSTQDNADEKYW